MLIANGCVAVHSAQLHGRLDTGHHGGGLIYLISPLSLELAVAVNPCDQRLNAGASLTSLCHCSCMCTLLSARQLLGKYATVEDF
jgi:hypothetical protein